VALLQISEPGQSPAPHARRHAIGIDLGTTNSLVAVVRNGIAETLPDERGRHLLPSVVRYRGRDDLAIGEEALASAAEDPLNTIASVKRLMGRGVEDVRRLGANLPYEFVGSESKMPRIRTRHGDVSPVEVSAEILKLLKQRADRTLAADVTDAVVTVPAYFDDAQRQATKDAVRLAGLNLLRLLSEPTAAAVAYGLDKNPEGIYVVYDLGGGTFDVSILRLHRGVFEVMATAGDSALGGDDIDHTIAAWMLQQAGVRDDIGQGRWRRLLRNARAAKEALTMSQQTAVDVESDDGSHWRGELTRVQLHALVDSLIERTLPPCRRALRDANLGAGDIQGVVLVGGSTRMPRVREKVQEFFGREPLSDIDPDKVVAIGAALQADILAGNRHGDETLLLDVIPLSLGLEVMGGMVEKIVPRNTTIPTARAQEFTTFKDGQTALLVHVVQGERELVTDCRSLARFELRGIPPKPAGGARIRVTFQVDADGLLAVSARELTTGVESNVVVKPSYGLTDAEVEKMLRDSIAYAREDEAARRLREEQVHADQLLAAVGAALYADGDALLSKPEKTEIEIAMARLGEQRHGTDVAAIREATQVLDKASQEFAARRMDAGIKRALTGHRVDELKSGS
jgi:molecular chaperone HscA